MGESGDQNREGPPTPAAGDASPLKRALLAIEKLQARLAAVERERTEPIAIIGMSCRFPGAPTIESYWELLRNGVDAIREVPPDRWDADAYFDPDPAAPAKMVTRWGGFVPEVDLFDPQFFGISPREAARMDPQQRLLLECSWEALERAGLAVERLAGSRTGVFIGISQVDYSLIQFEDRTQLDAYAGTGGALCIAANRISYLYDFRGPSVALDTACSSSLVSTHLAVESLRRRECDLALAGGVNLILSPELSITFSHAHMMAPDGRCKTFDAAADGYVRGEGCGVLALKRLSDAERDGDPVVAIILGSAVNQDGRSNGLTAPNGLAQQAVIRDALKNARVSPEQVAYVEAHGTGTILGDPIEMNSLAAVMAGRQDRCLVGSAKTNIGHLEAAAGVAGIIKVALMLQHGEIAPHLHFKQINPYIPIAEMPLEIATSAQAWPGGAQRIAGVSSFGFGGANAHLILGAAAERGEPVAARSASPAPQAERSHHVLALSAQSPAALQALAERHARVLTSPDAPPLADLCYTANAGRNALRHRRTIVAASTAACRDQLTALARELSDAPKLNSGKVAFLFTGQGSQYNDMGRTLYESHPTFRAAVEACSAILADVLPHPLLDVLYFGSPSIRSLIDETRYTQPGLFAIEYGLAQLWQEWGVQPDYLLGHSVGEYVAAVVGGVFSLADGLKLLAERGRLMGALPHDGAMAAVFAEPTRVLPILARRRQVGLAAVNGPKSVVISGLRESVEAAVVELEAAGLTVRPMRVSHAFHSPLMDPILDEFEAAARRITARAPTVPIVSNVTGQRLEAAPDARYWRRHVREAVQFNAGMRALAEAGCRVFVEAGPNPTLIGMGKRCLPGYQALWLPSLRTPEPNSERSEWPVLLDSVSQFWAAGHDVDWEAFDRPYPRRKVLAPTYPFQRERYWNESPLAAMRRKGWLGGAVEAQGGSADGGAGDAVSASPADAPMAGRAEEDAARQVTGVEQIGRADILEAPFEMRRDLLIDAVRGRLAKVLGLPVQRITPDQQLNHLGLDSIMAIELKGMVETALQIELPIAALLSGPTLVQLADTLLTLLEPGTTRGEIDGPPLLAEPRDEGPEGDRDYPLSVGQAAMWLQHQVAPGSVYNPVYAVRVHGRLDADRLAAAFQRLVDRHPALRTTFHSVDGRPAQRVHAHMVAHFAHESADELDDAALESRLADLAYDPFDIEHGPLLRIYLVSRGAERILLLAGHHIVVDLWSLAILISEVGTLYADPGAALSTLPLRYTDFVRWQGELLSSPVGEAMHRYWQERLAGQLPVLELPTDRPRPAVQTFQGSVESLDLGETLTRQVREFSAAAGVTPYVTLLAAFQALMHRYTGQDDVIVGSPTAGRSRAELANIVGYFVSPIAVRTSCAGDPSAAELVQRVREAALGGLAHADYPFPLLVEKLHPRRDPSRTPVFQAMFVLQRSHLLYEEGLSQFATGSGGTRMDLGGLPLESVAVRQRMSPFDLTLLIADAEKQYGAAVEYNLDLLDPATVQRMLGHYKTLLAGLVVAPERPLSALPLLTPKEEAQILQEWAVGPVAVSPLRHVCLHHAFETQVDATPDAIAVHFDPGDGGPPQVWTYRELDQRANGLAHHLLALGAGPEQRVALCLERSPEMIVAILAVLKAGAAYIPLDPGAPAERLGRILEDAQPVACICHASTRESLAATGRDGSAFEGRLIDLDDLGLAATDNRPRSDVSADNLAYVIYTSGSTGAPKGVMLQHAGAVNLVQAQVVGFDVTPQDRVYQFASYTFDASVSEIFIALTAGAALHISRRDVVLSPQNLARALARERITNITLPPTLLRLLDPAALPALRTVISAGDACTPDIVQKWGAGRRLLNAYGPTETTIGPTYHVVAGQVRGDTRVGPHVPAPVGRPIPNMRAYVLDRHGRAVPAGIPGELYIGGVGLARGYVGRPDLTAERFLPDPFTKEESRREFGRNRGGHRIYRTGDLVRWLPGGKLDFLGRADHQVKIRGFRVELGEIEAVLGKVPGIKQAVVLVHRADEAQRAKDASSTGGAQPPDSEPRLIAFIAPDAPPGPPEAEVRALLRSRLPDYMLPAAFVCLDALPLNASGKVDRASLRSQLPADLLSGARRVMVEVALPENQLERDLAGIWQQVLGVDGTVNRISVHDNFFDLGGHSLLMAQAHSRLQELLGREVPIVDLFRFPTIHLLAQHLAGSERDRATTPTAAQQGQTRGQQKRDALGARQARTPQRNQPGRGPTPRTEK